MITIYLNLYRRSSAFHSKAGIKFLFIYKFYLNCFKVNLSYLSDFESQLYLCHSGFEYLSFEVIKKLSVKTLVLPIFCLAFCYYFMIMIVNYFRSNLKTEKPELNYIVGNELIILIAYKFKI